MAYMSRLALWGPGTPFPLGFNEFIAALERRGGIGAMELVAMHLKRTGVFICRTLSFKGCSFEIVQDAVPEELIRVYDGAARLWQKLHYELLMGIKKELLIFARKSDDDKDEKTEDLLKEDDEDDEVLKIPKNSKNHGVVMRYFWGSHQRFFKSLCVALKVPSAIAIAQRALGEGKCVVIGLQSTGEAAMERSMKNPDQDSMDDFISSPMVLLKTVIKKIFPLPPMTEAEKRNTSINKLKGQAKKKAVNKYSGSSEESDEDDFDSEMDDFIVESDEAELEAGHAQVEEILAKGNASRKGKRATREQDSSDDAADWKPAQLQQHKKQRKSAVSNRTRSRTTTNTISQNTMSVRTNAQRKKFKCAGVAKSDDGSDELIASDGSDSDFMFANEIVLTHKISNRRVMEDSDEEHEEKQVHATAQQVVEELDDEMILNYLADDDLVLDLTVPSQEPPSASKSVAEIIKSPKEHRRAVQQLRARFIHEGKQLMLPSSPLDMLIDSLGGVDEVAEMTGRRARIVRDKKGKLVYEARNANGTAMEMQNIEERDRFMRGEKLVAIISEAASAGVSLQADRRVLNQRKRVHITLELPWSADKAVQQLGRTHRANQLHCPEYKLLMSPIGGERRFAAAVARRLESLGALTQGDRRATVGARSLDLGSMNLDNKYGRATLLRLFSIMCGEEFSMTLAEADENEKIRVQTFLNERRQESETDPAYSMPVGNPRSFTIDLTCNESTIGTTGLDTCAVLCAWMSMVDVNVREQIRLKDLSVLRFFNKLLGLEVYRQDKLFGLFLELLDRVVGDAKKEGTYDSGITHLQGKHVRLEGPPKVVYRDPSTQGETLHYAVKLDRGVSFEDAQAVYEEQRTTMGEKRWAQAVGDTDSQTSRQNVLGFWISRNTNFNKEHYVLLAFEKQTLIDESKLTNRQFMAMSVVIIRPPTGRRDMIRSMLLEKYTKCTPADAKSHWLKAYINDQTWRIVTYDVLAGSILPIWNIVENTLDRVAEHKRMKCVRVVLPGADEDAQEHIIGLQIDDKYIHTVLGALREAQQKLEQASAESSGIILVNLDRDMDSDLF